MITGVRNRAGGLNPNPGEAKPSPSGEQNPQPPSSKTSNPRVAKIPAPGVQKHQILECKDAAPGCKSTAPGCQIRPSWGQTRQTSEGKSAKPQGSKSPSSRQGKTPWRRMLWSTSAPARGSGDQPGEGLRVLPAEGITLGGGEEEGEPFPRGRRCLKGVSFGQRAQDVPQGSL